LGVQLSEEPGNITLLGIPPTAGDAARQLTIGMDIPPALLHEMADPDNATAVVEGAEIPLGEVPWYLERLHGVAHLLPADPVWSIGIVFGVLAALAIFGNFVRFFQEYSGEKAAILAVEDMRRQTYDHILHVPLGYFSLKGTSDIT